MSFTAFLSKVTEMPLTSKVTEAPFALEAEPLRPRRDAEAERRAKDRATALLAEIARRAEPLRVDPALFGSRAEVTAWVLDPDDPAAPLNRGWRREALGEALRRSL